MNPKSVKNENMLRREQQNRGINFENINTHHRAKSAFHPFEPDGGARSGYLGSQKEKKRYRYPIFSYIQELQDTIQTLFAAGTSLSGIKTVEMTESDIRMLPLSVGARVIGKCIVLSLLYFLIGFALFFVLSFIPKVYQDYRILSYVIFTLSFASSFLFYRYVIASMRQFVIIDEEVRKTQAFYAVVKKSWFIGMVIFVLCILIVFWTGFFKNFFLSILPVEYYLTKVANWISSFSLVREWVAWFNFHSLIDNLFNSLLLLSLNGVAILILYFIAGFIFDKHFKKKQQENNVKLYRDIDSSKAIEILNQG